MRAIRLRESTDPDPQSKKLGELGKAIENASPKATSKSTKRVGLLRKSWDITASAWVARYQYLSGIPLGCGKAARFGLRRPAESARQLMMLDTIDSATQYNDMPH
jgi:hypothetical protein